MLKPDSTRYSSVVQNRGIGPEWIEPDSAEPGVESADIVAFPNPTDLPAEIALDLRLLEIVQQARLSTAASGAVIALARGEKMVCRATLGEKAPRVGVCLNTRSGLSGACVQTREMQLCDDTLADPRVNVVACRDLGIRSIVVLPILDGAALWGVLEVFSSFARAFNESDLQALQLLSRKTSNTLHEALEDGPAALGMEPFSQLPAAEEAPAEVAVPKASEAVIAPDPQQHAIVARRDYRTGILTAAVLALAVLLGWMVGRVGWTLAVNRAPAEFPMTVDQEQAAARMNPDIRPAPPRQPEPAAPAVPVSSPPGPPVSARKPVLKPKPAAAAPVVLNGGLVVYEHGKVVFQSAPSEKESPPQAEPEVISSGVIQKAAAREDDSSASRTLRPPPSGYLLERVNPQYPEAARQQHIQGPVLLNVLVGTSGLVRDLTVISGDPLLAKAATDAVRQWRFNPHRLKDKAVEFETRITVNFALPTNTPD